jgi:hypothetical protein
MRYVGVMRDGLLRRWITAEMDSSRMEVPDTKIVSYGLVGWGCSDIMRR